MNTYRTVTLCLLLWITPLSGFGGQPAARQGDQTNHGGIITTGSATVLIGSLPAAKYGDTVACPLTTGTVPHIGGPITGGSATVLINGVPAARSGDLVLEAGGAISTIATGSSTVLIGP